MNFNFYNNLELEQLKEELKKLNVEKEIYSDLLNERYIELPIKINYLKNLIIEMEK